ncbi:MAG: carbamoyltransferase [Candidatus Altiarchaeota archaeon]
MNILGLSCYYHDASSCLIRDGEVIAAAEEERFTRKKHDTSFPIKSAEWCLQEAGINIDEVDYVAFYEKPLLKFERMMSQHTETFPKSYTTFLKTMPSWINEKMRVQSTIRKRLKYRKDVFYIEHHLAHAASSFFLSPFKEAAIMTIDGVGEWDTTTLGYGKDKDIRLVKAIEFPHSIGLLYSTITTLLGFKANNDEYKVMGLSPYGKPKYYDSFLKFMDVKDDGSYMLDMSYFEYHYNMRMPGRKMIDELCEVRERGGRITQEHKDIAATLQKITEDVIFRMLNHLHDTLDTDNLCIAGGVALNSVANGKIMKNTPFKQMYIQSAAGDGGTSMGAAVYAYNGVLGEDRKTVLDHSYLGPGYSTGHVKSFLEGNDITYSEFESDENLMKDTAGMIFEDKIVGWFQGRMEWGPRALGSRSILANPCNPDMKDIINARVKHREGFRPFAPAVPIEDAVEYFECDENLPISTDFMLLVYPVREDKRGLIPSVTHVDGSGRLQTVRKEKSPLYWGVIKEFEKLSGVPIIINTSFNVRGEPIVCSPYDAYRCMMGTGIDALVMDRFLIMKKDNMRDEWDSRRLYG